MKARLFLILALFLSCAASAGNIYYLQSAAGTWQGKPAENVITASSIDLKSGFPAFSRGDEVWVTNGDYSFVSHLKAFPAVTLRGGFAGTENTPDERDGKHTTWFKGNQIEQDSISFDGFSFSTTILVYGAVTIQNCVLSGQKNTAACPLNIHGDATHVAKLLNCWFYDNDTKRGAVACSYVIVSGCSFVNNHSLLSAGAIHTEHNVKIENSFFYNNTEGISYTKRDIYAGYSYRKERDINGNLISASANDYGTNTEYKHSDAYITFDANNCTLLQCDSSPFIDKGNVTVEEFPIKTIWGIHRFCDKIDYGCAEFSKAYALFSDINVRRPSFIKEEGWTVKDTSFVIESGLDKFYAPGSVVAYRFSQGDAFAVINWHFNEKDKRETDREWDLSKGDSVKYELDATPFDSLLISATQVVDTFKLKIVVPKTDGVKSTEMVTSEYNTSLSTDKQSAMVYVGEEVTLKAEYETEHHHFEGWYADNQIISGSPEFKYKVASKSPFGRDSQLVAAYILPDVMQVEYRILPDNSYGNVITDPDISSSQVVYGDSVNFTAIEAAGKMFKYWIDSCEVNVDTIYEKEFKAEILHNHLYKAVFEDIKYKVNVYSTVNGVRFDDTHKGIESLTGDGEFLYNESTALDLKAKDGYTFKGWLCSAISLDTIKSNPYTLSNIKKDYEFEACLTRITYSVKAAVEPAEWPVTITQSNPDGIYVSGDTAILTASDTARMEKWEKLSSDGQWKTYTSACKQIKVYNIDKDYELRAVYNDKLRIVTLKSDTLGFVTGAGTYELNSSVTVTATAEEGYGFAYWVTPSQEIVSYDDEFTFTLTQDTTLTAVFKQAEYKIYTKAVISNHTELEADDYVNYEKLTTVTYDSTATIKAECAEGFDVYGWVITDLKEEASKPDTIKGNPLVLTNVKCNKLVKLVVKHRILNVKAFADPDSLGFEVEQTNPDGIYYYGDTVVITSDTSRYFASWLKYNGNMWIYIKSDETGDDNTLVINGVKEDMSIKAFYNMDKRFINFEVNNSEYGYVEYKNKNYDYFQYGDTCTVTAYTYEDPSVSFVKWTSSDALLSTENPMVFRIETDSTIVANFIKDEPTVAPDIEVDSDAVSEQKKPYKTIINNQIFIIYDDKMYNLLGVEQ